MSKALRIEGRLYQVGGLYDLPLRGLVELDLYLQTSGATIRHWWQVAELTETIRLLPERFQAEHPEFGLVVAVRVWASRCRAGERIGFLDALDVDATAVEELDLGDEVATAEALPPGFEAGNTQEPADLEIEELDVSDDVRRHILGVMLAFPQVTWWGVWDMPLHMWVALKAQTEILRRG